MRDPDSDPRHSLQHWCEAIRKQNGLEKEKRKKMREKKK